MALERKKNEGKEKEKWKRKGSLLEEQECSTESDCSGYFLVSQVLLVFLLYQCLVWMKWPGNTVHLNAIFPAAQPSETMSNANWTEQHWNTLRLTLQDSFPPYVNYAQREYSANHKPGKACKNMCPSLKLQLLKPRGLTFAVQTLGFEEDWGLGDVEMAGEQGRESGLMLGDLELCSFNLAAKGGCFPISISGYNSAMHSSFWRRAPTLSAPNTPQKCACQISGEVWKELAKLQSNSEIFLISHKRAF